MAQPIKHDSGDVIEEAAYGAGRGALAGLALTFAAGAAIPLVIGGAAAALGATVAIGPLAVGAAAAGLAMAVFGGPVMAAIGALFGTIKSSNRVSKENVAYNEKMKEKVMGREAEIVAARNEAMQMGFQAGAEQGRQVGQQEGAQMVMAKLQEHAQAEQAQPQHAAAEHTHAHAHAHHEEKHHEGQPQKSFAAVEDQRRTTAAAAAVAGAQLGA